LPPSLDKIDAVGEEYTSLSFLKITFPRNRSERKTFSFHRPERACPKGKFFLSWKRKKFCERDSVFWNKTGKDGKERRRI